MMMWSDGQTAICTLAWVIYYVYMRVAIRTLELKLCLANSRLVRLYIVYYSVSSVKVFAFLWRQAHAQADPVVPGVLS